MTTIDFELCCIHCGYNLRTLAPASVCPECGRPAGESLNLGAIDPMSGTVRTDVACIRCGYNLRTLAPASVCPECAAPVIKSLRPDLLEFAETRWLRTVRQGLVMTAVYCALSPVLMLMVPLLARFMTPTTLGRYQQGFGSLLSFGLLIVWCIGLLQIATSEPAREYDRRSRRFRGWIRILAILAPVASLLTFALTVVFQAVAGGRLSSGPGTGGWSPSGLAAWYCFLVPLVMVTPIGALILSLYLRDLAARARRGKGVFTAFAVFSVINAATRLTVYPVMYLYWQSISAGASPTGNRWFFWMQLTQGASQLCALALGLVGFIASLVAWRMISRALRQQV